MNETFFIRIPTKSLDTLKKIYLIFLVQTLVIPKDSKGNKIKASNFHNEMDNLCKNHHFIPPYLLCRIQDRNGRSAAPLRRSSQLHREEQSLSSRTPAIGRTEKAVTDKVRDFQAQSCREQFKELSKWGKANDKSATDIK